MTEDDADGENGRADETEELFEDIERDAPAHDGDPFSELTESYDSADRQETESGAEFSPGDPVINSSAPAAASDESLWGDSSTSENEGEMEAWPDASAAPEAASQLSPSADADLFIDSVSRSGDPFEPDDGLFERADVETVDPDSIWQELASTSDGSARDRVRTYADVSKHAFCEQCEHFSKPPAVTCNHDGTEIVEFRDMETVRLIDCPVVAEREALESETSSTRYEPQ